MSFLLKNTKFNNKKINLQNINLDIKSSNVVSLLARERQASKQIKNILIGNHSVKSGIFKIDGYDKVNKQWTKTRVSLIKPGNRFFRQWPEKFWLYFSLLFNKNFYTEAKVNYLNSKYSFLSFSTSKNNETDLSMRRKVELMIEKFIDGSIEVEEQWLSDFLKQIVTFNDSNLEERYPNLAEHIKIITRDYFYLKEKTANLELFQNFLQSLWDKVYSFIDLNSLCTCEYNANKSKQKSIKKKAKELNFRQHIYLVRKHLKIIDVKVGNVKSKIEKNKFVLKGLEKQIKQELIKFNYAKQKKVKTLETFFSWRQLVQDQRYEFRKKQEKMFYDALFDESTTLRGKIVEVMHKYHKKVLDDDVMDGDFNKFREKKRELKNKITSVYKQAITWTDTTAEDLGISFNLLKNSLKFSAINNIQFKLLKSVYLNKYNIIFYNVLEKLSYDEAEEIINAANNLKKLNPKFTVVFIEKSINKLHNVKEDFVLVENSFVKKTNLENLLGESWSTYGSDFFIDKNRVPFTYDGKNLRVDNQKVKLETKSLPLKGQILLNPFEIYTNKKDITGHYFEFQGEISKNNIFIDREMYEVVLNNDAKILFYSPRGYDIGDKVKIYFNNKAILKAV